MTKKIYSKWLKPVNGLYIDKSWKLNANGTIKKSSIVYTVYERKDGDFLDSFNTLAKAQKFAREYK